MCSLQCLGGGLSWGFRRVGTHSPRRGRPGWAGEERETHWHWVLKWPARLQEAWVLTGDLSVSRWLEGQSAEWPCLWPADSTSGASAPYSTSSPPEGQGSLCVPVETGGLHGWSPALTWKPWRVSAPPSWKPAQTHGVPFHRAGAGSSLPGAAVAQTTPAHPQVVPECAQPSVPDRR